MDALRLASLPRDVPLLVRSADTPFTCAICGVRQEAYVWRVTLPQRAGQACTACTVDAGFTVR